ncbi:MAG: Plug domain-containing protein [Niveispirillum sp.]|nr:Plug domain-containing protein [Niveispirillum sp.]
MLEEIIVTAQKRRESIQDVPVAVSALTGESLAENNVRTLEDLSASVPGFTIAANVNYGSAPMSIRGVGGANGGGNVFADEPVATYVNDAFVGRLRMSTADLVDIGSVEVLRGPQDACAAVSRVRSSRPRPPCWRRSGSA